MAKGKTPIAEGLQLEEDRAWQERFWTAQRVAWIVMALIVFAALLGALGKGGPLANARVETSAGTIDYPRITRWQSSDQFSVTLPPGAPGQVDVEVERSFADLFSIDSIEPEPSQVVATGEGQRFTFDLANGSGRKSIAFHVSASNPALPRTIGARIGDAPPARMVVTVLP